MTSKRQNLCYNRQKDAQRTCRRYFRSPRAAFKEIIDAFKLKPNDFMFYKSKPLAPQSLRHDMDKYIKLAGVKRITPHQFRHTHAAIIFSTGASKAEDAHIVAHRL